MYRNAIVALFITICILLLSSIYAEPQFKGYLKPNVYVFCPEELWGGDVFYFNSSDGSIRIIRSGLLFRDYFDVLNTSRWTIISGEWTVKNGILECRGLEGDWSFIVLNIPFYTGIYQLKLNLTGNSKGGISCIPSLDYASEDPLYGDNVVFSIIAETSRNITYNPPKGAVSSILTPRSKWFHLKITYNSINSHAYYSSTIYVDDEVFPIQKRIETELCNTYLRIAVYGTEAMYVDEVSVCESANITVTGLEPGLIVELIDENNRTVERKISMSDKVVFNLEDYIFPLKGWSIRIVAPPLAIIYLEDMELVYPAGLNFTISGNKTSCILKVSPNFPKYTEYNITWIVPDNVAIINMTIDDGITRFSITDFSEKSIGFFKMVNFSSLTCYGDLILNFTAPNIVSSIRIEDITLQVTGPEDVNPEDRLKVIVYTTIDDQPLPNVDVTLTIINRSSGEKIAVVSTTSDNEGKATFYIVAPASPFRIAANATFSTVYRRLVGYSLMDLKLRTVLTINSTKNIVPIGEVFNLTAQLISGNRGISNKLVRFEKKIASGWIPVGAALTDSNGTAYFPVSISCFGEAYYRAVFDGDDMYTGSISNEIVVVALKPSFLKIEGPHAVSIGRSFNITIILNGSDRPLGNRAVCLEKSYDGINWQTVDTIITNSYGVAVITLSENRTGTVYYRARFAGDNEYYMCESNVIRVGIGKIKTRIELILPEIANVTRSFTIKAILYDDLNNSIPKRIVVFLLKQNNIWYEVGRVQADKSGVAELTININKTGYLEVKAYFAGDQVYEESYSYEGKVFVDRLSTRIEIGAASYETYVNKPFILMARLIYINGTPIEGGRLKIYKLPDKSLISIVYTNISGYAIIKITESRCGNYSYYAVFEGDAIRHPSVSDKIKIRVKRIGTFLTLSVSNSNPMESEPFVLVCQLKDTLGRKLAGKKILFFKSKDGVKWEYMGMNITDVNGVAMLKVVENDMGTYIYMAVFEGDEEYLKATSNTLMINVRIGMVKIILIATAVILVLVLITYFIHYRKTKIKKVKGLPKFKRKNEDLLEEYP